jgi:hypothetical protein
LHHNSFRGSLVNVVTEQSSVDLQQKISSQELAKVDLQQENPSR